MHTYPTGIRSGIVAALLAAFAFSAVPLTGARAGDEEGAVAALRKTGKAFVGIAREASPAVVFIRSEKSVQRPAIAIDPFFQRFFGGQLPQGGGEETVVGQGSGFIFDSSGLILTNAHVVSGASSVEVTLDDGRSFPGTIVGADPPTDVAVVKIDAKDLPTIPFGNSDDLEVGEWVVAMGNPFGLSHTLTVGVVSAKGRSSLGIEDYESFIQTDAAINPGNSGGPLLNLEGEAVGINTAIVSGRTGGSVGVGFAIPINMVKMVQAQLQSKGEVTRAHLGVMIQGLTPALAQSFGLDRAEGALVAKVEPDSPAEHAGLKTGDVILTLDGKDVKSSGEFRNDIALGAPGRTVDIGVLRDGKRKEFSVKLDKLASSETPAAAQPAGAKRWGMTLSDMTPEIARQLGLEGVRSGVVITGIENDSPAERAGLRPGTLILEVDRKKVSSVDEARDALAKAGDRVLLLVGNQNSTVFVVLEKK